MEGLGWLRKAILWPRMRESEGGLADVCIRRLCLASCLLLLDLVVTVLCVKVIWG